MLKYVGKGKLEISKIIKNIIFRQDKILIINTIFALCIAMIYLRIITKTLTIKIYI